MKELIALDKHVFLALNNLGNTFWDPFWLMVSEVFIWIPFYALLIYIIFRKLARADFFLALGLIFLNVVLTDQLSVALFKDQFQRLRPCHVEELISQMRLVKEGCGGYYGFISSHASNTFGLAVLLGGILRSHFRFALAGLLAWALLVSYSRIYLGVHYPLDILGGAVFGSGLGMIMLFIYQRFKR